MGTCGKSSWRAAALALGLGVMLLCAPAGGQDVTAEQVAGAVSKSIAYLRQQLEQLREQEKALVRNNQANVFNMGRVCGQKALAVLALRNAGVPADDPLISQCVQELSEIPDFYTYTVSLKCQVLAISDLKKYRKPLQASAAWLVKTQLPTGMWTYGDRRGGGDNSNTQFALLGLHEAAKAGINVEKEVWDRARRHFENSQNRDGGWGYTPQQPQSYGSMSAAGVASLFICGQELFVGGRKAFIDGAYPGCGRYRQSRPLAAGLGWLGTNFSVSENPNHNRSWVHYYLYALERVGMISGLQRLGRHDWYRQGAAELVGQQALNGSFGSVENTAFALLFLAKGDRPVLIQKVQWKSVGDRNDWNRNVHDLEHLTAFASEKFDKAVTWQTTSLDATLRELRMSPVLLITGHRFPEFTAADRQKLRDYVESGGILLFEACCGSKDFDTGFRELAKALYAEIGKVYPLHPLAADHSVFHSLFDLDDTYGLEGIDIGCKTGIFYSPNALCCLWEMNDYKDAKKDWSAMALRLGTNIAAYATGRERLTSKLAEVTLPAKTERRADQPAEIPRGAVRIARLITNGDYQADPHATVALAGLLRDRAKVDVVSKGRYLKATDPALYEYPVIFVTGHHAFKLSDEEVLALREYLQRGGFLFADSCCGRAEFDKSFRALADRLLPGQKLAALPADHPIYSGDAGLRLGELRYRAVLAQELKDKGVEAWQGTTRPALEGLSLDGRTVLLYSPLDFSCALEGDNPYSCRGYVDGDGQKLALSIVLYAIAY